MTSEEASDGLKVITHVMEEEEDVTLSWNMRIQANPGPRPQGSTLCQPAFEYLKHSSLMRSLVVFHEVILIDHRNCFR